MKYDFITILAWLTLKQTWRKIAVGAVGAIIVIAATMTLHHYLNAPRPVNPRGNQQKLRALHAAMRDFQSEAYFARAPKNLEELWRLPPAPDGVEITPLLHLAEPSDSGADLTAEFILIPYYDLFLRGDAIIMLDAPGNFPTGGNVLFNDGRVEFLAMAPEEYARFVEAINQRRDRDFVRQKCADCAIAGFAP
jgi:hypothetical protein